jgi:hypothetical protein
LFFVFLVEMLIFAWPSKRAHFWAGINPIKFFPVASCNLLKWIFLNSNLLADSGSWSQCLHICSHCVDRRRCACLITCLWGAGCRWDRAYELIAAVAAAQSRVCC